MSLEANSQHLSEKQGQLPQLGTTRAAFWKRGEEPFINGHFWRVMDEPFVQRHPSSASLPAGVLRSGAITVHPARAKSYVR